MGIRLRQAPSGALLEGSSDGQVPVWNNTTKQWDVGGSSLPSTFIVFDSVESIEAQFPAVAGVHTLDVSAVYVFAAPLFSLAADERIVVTAPRAALMGSSTRIAGNNASDPLLTCSGSNEVSITDIQLFETGGASGALATTCPVFTAFNCDFNGTDYGADIQSGVATLVACRSWGANGGVLSGGTTKLIGCALTGAGTDTAVNVTRATDSLQIIGGSLDNHSTSVRIGAAVDDLLLSGIYVPTTTTFLIWAAGVVGHASVTDCHVAACTTGVDWAAVNLPTNGLTLQGDVLLASSASVTGFDETTSGIMLRACRNTSGLMPETPIVV